MKSLQDYDEKELRAELDRRRRMQDLGLCDYCERNGDAAACAHPKRHDRAKVRSMYERLVWDLQSKSLR